MKSIKKYHLICAVLAVFLSATVLAATNTYAGEDEEESLLQADLQTTETSKTTNEGSSQYIKDGEKEPVVNIPLSAGLKAFFMVELPKGDKTEELLSKIRNDMDYTNYRALFGIRIPL